MRTIVPLFLLALATGSLASAQNDHLVLTDGQAFQGDVVGAHASGLLFAPEKGQAFLQPWSGIREIGSRSLEVGFGAGQKISGAIIGLESGTHLLLRSDLLGIVRVPLSALDAAPELEETPAPQLPEVPEDALAAEVKGVLAVTEWNGRVALGLSLSTGNSDVFTATLDALLQRDWAYDHLEFRAFAVYGTSEGEVNRDGESLSGLLRHYYADDFYSYASIEVSRDQIQDRDFRGLANVGAGTVLWKESDKEQWLLEGGIGYRVEVFSGDTDTRSDATARAATVYQDLWFEKRLEFLQSAEIIFPLTEPSSFLARSETVLGVPLSESWSARLSIRLEYNNDPADGRSSLDTLATLGLEYKF